MKIFLRPLSLEDWTAPEDGCLKRAKTIIDAPASPVSMEYNVMRSESLISSFPCHVKNT